MQPKIPSWFADELAEAGHRLPSEFLVVDRGPKPVEPFIWLRDDDNVDFLACSILDGDGEACGEIFYGDGVVHKVEAPGSPFAMLSAMAGHEGAPWDYLVWYCPIHGEVGYRADGGALDLGLVRGHGGGDLHAFMEDFVGLHGIGS